MTMRYDAPSSDPPPALHCLYSLHVLFRRPAAAAALLALQSTLVPAYQ